MKRFDILYVPSIKSLGDKLKRFIVSNNQLLKQFYRTINYMVNYNKELLFIVLKIVKLYLTIKV